MFSIFNKGQCHVRVALLLAGVLLVAGACICVGAYASTVHTITIEGMQFSPKTLEVNVGDTVVWQNKDLVTHTATADNKTFSSGEIPVNHSWKFVAHKKGTFPYACALHPTMKAILVVH